jgi:hypothetical protein
MPSSTLSISSSGETRFITLYDDQRCSPGPRPADQPEPLHRLPREQLHGVRVAHPPSPR